MAWGRTYGFSPFRFPYGTVHPVPSNTPPECPLLVSPTEGSTIVPEGMTLVAVTLHTDEIGAVTFYYRAVGDVDFISVAAGSVGGDPYDTWTTPLIDLEGGVAYEYYATSSKGDVTSTGCIVDLITFATISPLGCPTITAPVDGLERLYTWGWQIQVTWTAGLNAVSYNVYKNDVFVANTSSLFYTFADSNGTLGPNTTHTFRVTSVRGDEESSGCGSVGISVFLGWDSHAGSVNTSLDAQTVNETWSGGSAPSTFPTASCTYGHRLGAGGKWYYEISRNVPDNSVVQGYSVSRDPLDMGTSQPVHQWYVISRAPNPTNHSDDFTQFSGTSVSVSGIFSQSNAYQLAFDADNGKVYIGVDNSWKIGNPNGGSGTVRALPFDVSELSSVYLYPYTILTWHQANTNTKTGAFTRADCSFTPPTGYLAWDGT